MVISAAEKNKYLTFMMDSEVFALEISRVREVLNTVAVTKIPGMPEYVRGVINLRGGAVPVVDLRLMFGIMASAGEGKDSIIIVEVLLNSETVVLGVLVDSVQEVFEMSSDQIEPPPVIGKKLDTEFIRGMGKRDREFIIIIDIDRVFAEGELEVVKKAGAELTADNVKQSHVEGYSRSIV